MAELHFEGHGDAASLPPYLNPNIFFQSDPNDQTLALPTQGTPVYILASVKNAGLQSTDGASVRFFICDPSTAPTPANSVILGGSNVFLNAGETKTILCVTPWVPDWTNNGHVCVICEAFAANDGIQQPSNAAWDLSDRHVGQRNVIVVRSPDNHRLLLSMAATGLFNHNVAKISMRPAGDREFDPALRSVGLADFSNASFKMNGSLIEDYIQGYEPPKERYQNLEFSRLAPNMGRGFHALVQFPPDASKRSAGIMLVEQHDLTGKLVGGVAIIVLNGEFMPMQVESGPPPIPASIPHRPYATNAISGLMNVDGIFVTNLSAQLVNVEMQNDSTDSLDSLSMYIEGIGDPNIVVPLNITSPIGGNVLPGASFKSIFPADFTTAAVNETMVSFIVQRQSGASSTMVRILKKIFVMSLSFDKTSKIFEARVPQGSLFVHINTVIAPKPPALGSGGSDSIGDGCCCCKCGQSGTSSPGTDPSLNQFVPYPVFIKSGTAIVVPSPYYSGNHGPLPFDDPLWKAIIAVIGAILAIAGAVVAGETGGEGSVGAEGTYDEQSGEATCCQGQNISASTGNGIAAGLIGAGAVCLAVAAASDGQDWHERGEEATPPDAGELTVGEFVKFDIDYPSDIAVLGQAFNTNVKWSYERTLDSGRSLRFEADDKDYTNQHLLKSYRVSIDGTASADRHYSHYRKNPLIIGAQFVKPDGTLFRGSDLYVVAVLASDHGRRTGVELRDDGYGYLAGFNQQVLQSTDAGEKDTFVFASQKNPLHQTPTRLISDSGVAIVDSKSANHTLPTASIVERSPEPNIGSYVGVPTSLNDSGVMGPETWYIFVFAQDVNTVFEGTESREAAKTIGGILLTSNFVIGFNDHPCELNYDAAVTVM